MAGSSPEVEKNQGWVAAVELGSRRRCGDRGIEEGIALCDFGSVLRHVPPPVCRWHPGVSPGRPRVRLANAEGSFGRKLAPPRAVLREGGPFGEGERGAVRARLSKVLEMALNGFRWASDGGVAAAHPKARGARELDFRALS